MPADQPRPEVKPTREHLTAARSFYEDKFNVYLGEGHNVVALAKLLASRDAAAYERGLNDGPAAIGKQIETLYDKVLAKQRAIEAAEERGRLLERAEVVSWLRGPGLDELDQYTLLAVLASVERRDHLPAQPQESATPAAAEAPALERKLCGLCGGDGFHVQGPGVYRDCERRSGTGKEPT